MSSLQYVHHWQDAAIRPRPYFKTLFADLDEQEEPVPVVDTIVPTSVMLGWATPTTC